MAKPALEKIDEGAVLTVRIPSALREMIDYVADQREETVTETVHSMLEEIVDVERVRRMSSAQSHLEQKALFGSRKAKRAAAAAWEAVMTAWRTRRPKTAPTTAVLAIEVASSRMEEIEYLAARRSLSVRTFAPAMINEIVDLVHERSMSAEEAALRRQSADPDLSRAKRMAAWREARVIWETELSTWREERDRRHDRPAKARRSLRARRSR
jgi:hypothetical protein